MIQKDNRLKDANPQQFYLGSYQRDSTEAEAYLLILSVFPCLGQAQLLPGELFEGLFRALQKGDGKQPRLRVWRREVDASWPFYGCNLVFAKPVCPFGMTGMLAKSFRFDWQERAISG